MAVAKAKKPSKIKKVPENALQMHQLLLNSKRLVVGDIETTGFSPDKGGRIFEVAGVAIEDGKIVDTFTQLIDPGVKISQKIIDLTGVTNEMVAGKPAFGQVLPDFYRFIGDSVFVAHKADFDWGRFLQVYFRKVGIIASNQIICTNVLAKLYLPDLPKHDLKGICKEAGVEIANHHRALDDSIALAHVVLHYLKTHAPKYGSVPTNDSEPVQTSLFEEVVIPKKGEKEMPKVVPITFKIKRVSYWEKEITKQKKMQRIYVLLSIGSVYFDIPTKTWYNKDVQVGVNFEEVNQRVLDYLKLGSQEELCQYRNSK
ncbi:PolC-type DNA polymerase III [Brevibacillus sp. NPDC058079]|uniref:3'-5' exonuclease n=1 Tax=Brevibacillus sp. NPDC058079 TaxID=3346330 RepID=UPI0036E54C29